MDCKQQCLSDEEYILEFNRKALQQRIPLSGIIELTHRCNLRCVHCYLNGHARSSFREELGINRIVSLIDEITEAGCLSLVITGGEPLLRNDFADIYSHAKLNGLIVTVFTNGTCITEDVLSLFESLPPYAVEISLYGATAATYEKITGVPGSYEKCINGIKRLLDRRIPVRLKTILMTLNSDEFFAIEDMAKEFGVKFRFDAAISPRTDGDKTPVLFRVSPKDAVEKEFSDEDKVRLWGNHIEKFREQPLPDELYNCGAGLTGFYISPYGDLSPCIMTSHIKFNVADASFLEGWQDIIIPVKDKKAGNIYMCNMCERRHICSFCPGFFYMETGREDIRSDYICAMGNYRSELIEKRILSGGQDAR